MPGLRLGSVRDIEIRLDHSWFVIFALVVWTLAAGYFPATVPGLSPTTYLAMAVVGAALFFAALLAHELSHSLVARSRGIEVERITLFVFGGVASLKGEPRSPRDEFLITVVGPLASVLIGLAFMATGAVGRALGWPDVVVAVAGYLGFINLAIAIFNLLPGFPLDGGRLFRAAVWHFTGDATKATRWATASGRGLGALLIALGALEVILVGNIVGGLWLALIGWFLRTAARASLVQHVLFDALRGVQVADVMTPRPTTVPASLSLADFVEQYFLEGRHQAYPVVDHAGDAAPVGIISLAGVRSIPRSQWRERTVRDAMRALDADNSSDRFAPATLALERLAATPDGRLLVLSDGALVGIMTRADLARWLERARLLSESVPAGHGSNGGEG